MTPETLAAALQGRVAIPYEDAGNPGLPITLECYRPANHAPDRPMVIVQHGMGRNGDEYRDAWIPAADRHGLLIVAPTFSTAAWPGSGMYNEGRVFGEDGAVRARAGWSNGVPASVFALLQKAGITTRRKAYLWGHSAGGQFVHRLLGLQSHDAFEAVGAANSGWYMRASFEARYPEGLDGIGLDDAAAAAMLAYPMVIFAGDRDVETAADNLPKQAGALAQGPHRFARAHWYLEAGRAEAARRGMVCGWKLVVVPGIGHEGMLMAAAAAEYWFDGRMPVGAASREAVGTEL